MNLNIFVKNKVSPEKGDVIVMVTRNPLNKREYVNYLIIEDKPNENFTVMNMEMNNLMSSIRASSPVELVEVVKERFHRSLEFIEIIPEAEVVVSRV